MVAGRAATSEMPPAAFDAAVDGSTVHAVEGSPAEALYSITSHFDGACNVLLTGASGYIGSLVLEKLLRSTNVGRVYVLLRPRRGVAPADRLAKLLTGPLFHLLDETHAERVTAVAGDILEPGLGLSAEDEAMLVANVDTVIHSAAGAAGLWTALFGLRPRAWRRLSGSGAIDPPDSLGLVADARPARSHRPSPPLAKSPRPRPDHPPPAPARQQTSASTRRSTTPCAQTTWARAP